MLLVVVLLLLLVLAMLRVLLLLLVLVLVLLLLLPLRGSNKESTFAASTSCLLLLARTTWVSVVWNGTAEGPVLSAAAVAKDFVFRAFCRCFFLEADICYP